MATAIGQRMLVRYYEADEVGRVELRPKLDLYRDKAQITVAEHERAVAGEPPVGYVAPIAAAEPASDPSTSAAATSEAST